MTSSEKNVSCVFVRGIPYGLDQKAVEAAFAEIGPLRNCFLVKEKGQQRHKGIGFVHFAIPEDADRAVAALTNTELGGRNILVPRPPPPCRSATCFRLGEVEPQLPRVPMS